MADKITKKFNITMSGLLTIDGDALFISCEDGDALFISCEDGDALFISCEDGAQDVNLAKLLADFDGRPVKISCNYDEEYSEDEASVDVETGEVI